MFPSISCNVNTVLLFELYRAYNEKIISLYQDSSYFMYFQSSYAHNVTCVSNGWCQYSTSVPTIRNIGVLKRLVFISLVLSCSYFFLWLKNICILKHICSKVGPKEIWTQIPLFRVDWVLVLNKFPELDETMIASNRSGAERYGPIPEGR